MGLSKYLFSTFPRLRAEPRTARRHLSSLMAFGGWVSASKDFRGGLGGAAGGLGGVTAAIGNTTLTFNADSPEEAEKVLRYYVDELRDLLRGREISGSSVVIDSLRAEALSTADPLLRSQLYTLEAKQLQRRKMAQVEADFAFRILDAPAAPDKKYRPLMLLDCLAAGLVAAVASALFVLLRYRPSQEENRSNVFLGPVGITSRKIDAAGGSAQATGWRVVLLRHCDGEFPAR